MKKLLTITACAIPLAFGSAAYAQTPPPAEKPAVTTAENAQNVSGWSIKENIMGKDVYNEKGEKVGDIRDVILDSDGKAADYVIGVGGFLGMGEHDVAIPFDKLQVGDDRFVLQGYTKEQLKDLPKATVR